MTEINQKASELETMGLMAQGLAHKLNNLLTIIISNSNFILEEFEQDNPLRNDVETIRQAGARGSDLIRHMTMFTQKKAPQPEVTDLNHLIREMSQTLQQIMGALVDLKTSLDSNLEKVLIDPAQLEDVIMSVAMNAKDAMPGGGGFIMETAHVKVDEKCIDQWSGSKHGSYVILIMTDSGTGMDAHTLKRVFDPFFTTKKNKKNIGLGLFTARYALNQMNAWIEVRSEPNHGTKVKVYLPIAGKA